MNSRLPLRVIKSPAYIYAQMLTTSGMNRKTAIKRLALLGAGGLLAYTGYRGYRLYRQPPLDELDQYQAVLNELAGVIIPTTDTPGAKEANVGPFIVRMVRDCSSKQSQNNFIEGIEDLVAYSKSEYGKPFEQCSATEQAAILSRFERKGRPYAGFFGKVEKRLAGDSFFTTLKRYTVLGYGSSRPGCTEGLAYDYIPGRFVAETTLTPGQKAWATN